ncbi:CHAP domain-containing protein [Cryobacterium sp. AP23]
MTFSGPAGSPEGDGALPTRRELRARRDAEALAAGSVTPVPESSVPESSVAESSVAVPVPPVQIVSAAQVLAVVVETAQPAAVPSPARRAPVRPARAYARATPPPVAPRPRATGRIRAARKPMAKLLTLVAIPAIFLTTALPSYAFAPQGSIAVVSGATAEEAQRVTVAAAAAAVTISADGFSATSQAELDEAEAALQAELAQKAAAAAGFAVYGIRAEGDDYPWMGAATESQGGGLSPLGYYYRECVDFVAWRLNRDAGASGSPWKWTWGNLTPGGGNGSAWAGNWAAQGRPTGKTPVVGAVATFSYNHVAYVQSVPGDGTVVLEEYNWMGSHAYHTRTIPISEVKLFLYPPT